MPSLYTLHHVVTTILSPTNKKYKKNSIKTLADRNTCIRDLPPTWNLFLPASKKLYYHLIKATTLISAGKRTCKQVVLLGSDCIFSKKNALGRHDKDFDRTSQRTVTWLYASTTRGFVARFVVVSRWNPPYLNPGYDIEKEHNFRKHFISYSTSNGWKPKRERWTKWICHNRRRSCVVWPANSSLGSGRSEKVRIVHSCFLPIFKKWKLLFFFTERSRAKLENTGPLIYIALNHKSEFCDCFFLFFRCFCSFAGISNMCKH